MSAMIQNVLVAVIVAGAVAFLIWKRVRARRRATPFCENCPGCQPAPPPADDVQLVHIGEPTVRH